jgi:hypothetical protein
MFYGVVMWKLAGLLVRYLEITVRTPRILGGSPDFSRTSSELEVGYTQPD